MMNILFPMGGKSVFFEEYHFPKPLIEILGKSMIQTVVENYTAIEEDKRFIFVVNESDCTKYHLDSVLNIITNGKAVIVKLGGETKGAACSALMAVEHINNDDPLIIANCDQLIDSGIKQGVSYFREHDADAGVICIETVHPRWSYVRLNDEGKVIETAEKRPLSKYAIAGFYYFKHGKDFVQAAMSSIMKDNNVEGVYYIAPTINEMVLKNKDIQVFMISNDKYHTFYTPQKIKEYEQKKSNAKEN